VDVYEAWHCGGGRVEPDDDVRERGVGIACSGNAAATMAKLRLDLSLLKRSVVGVDGRVVHWQAEFYARR
jgi:hypothetical protein